MPQASNEMNVSNDAIEDAVRRELEMDPRVGTAHIGVSAYDGAIVLSGRVAAYPEKLAAVRAAERVHGVRAIADEIEVKVLGSSGVDDQAIAEQIARQLQWNVVVPDTVTAEVSHGNVTLQGRVTSDYQLHAAEGPIQLVRGVASLTNLITTEPGQKLTADEITHQVREALGNLADLRSVRITTSDGLVHLEGEVHTLEDRRIAEHTAGSISGIERLENDIVLDGGAGPQFLPALPHRSGDRVSTAPRHSVFSCVTVRKRRSSARHSVRTQRVAETRLPTIGVDMPKHGTSSFLPALPLTVGRRGSAQSPVATSNDAAARNSATAHRATVDLAVDASRGGDASPTPPRRRSVRRATAKRANSRRATARELRHDPDAEIIGFLTEHPGSTVGDLSKGLDLGYEVVAGEHVGKG
jgi:osmotically-inducible protein OsmY